MDRVLTTHTGSLIRPPELLELAATIDDAQPHDRAAYEEALEHAVTDVVARQVAAGIDIVDDGEMGKANWITYLYERIRGIEPTPRADRSGRHPASEQGPAGVPGVLRRARRSVHPRGLEPRACDAPARNSKPSAGSAPGRSSTTASALERDIARFKRALAGRDVIDAFLPVVAPASVYWLQNEHYATEEEFVFAVADALHEEYRRIVDAGFMLQVDDAVLLHEYDSILASGGSIDDYRRWASLRIEALNHALTGIPEERIRYHVCFGSWHGPHAFDPPLADVIDLVLDVRARYYLIEQANPRHEHEWRLWEDVALPEGKVLVPGVVTHHTNVVEHPQLVADRIVRIATLLGADRVMGGTDCGFAQSAFVHRVHPSIQWAKLEALAEGARIATERLYGRAAT